MGKGEAAARARRRAALAVTVEVAQQKKVSTYMKPVLNTFGGGSAGLKDASAWLEGAYADMLLNGPEAVLLRQAELWGLDTTVMNSPNGPTRADVAEEILKRSQPDQWILEPVLRAKIEAQAAAAGASGMPYPAMAYRVSLFNVLKAMKKAEIVERATKAGITIPAKATIEAIALLIADQEAPNTGGG